MGTGDSVAITLYVIGEGRWEAQNFPNLEFHGDGLVWDFGASRSNYAEMRQGLLATGDGRTWLTTFAKKGALLSTLPNPLEGGATVTYATTGSSLPSYYGPQIDTIAWLYVAQGMVDAGTKPSSGSDPYGPPPKPACVTQIESHVSDDSQVTDPTLLACDKLDDLGVAFVGLHPKDVWLTRMEATLPRAALAQDLAMTASSAQTPVENWHTAKLALNASCPLQGSVAPAAWDPPSPKSPNRSTQRWAAIAVAFGALGSWLARRGTRRRAAVVG